MQKSDVVPGKTYRFKFGDKELVGTAYDPDHPKLVGLNHKTYASLSVEGSESLFRVPLADLTPTEEG